MEAVTSMQTKLTLRLDEQLIKKAKAIAEKNGKSLSKIVEDYFSSMKMEGSAEHEPLTPRVRSLKGLLKNSRIKEKDYHDYLEKKYK